MFLSNFSIKKPIATIVVIISLMALGLMALNKLRVNSIPDVQEPMLFLSIAYPGASPDTVEREVVKALLTCGVDRKGKYRNKDGCESEADVVSVGEADPEAGQV